MFISFSQLWASCWLKKTCQSVCKVMNRKGQGVILIIAWLMLGDIMSLCQSRKLFYRNSRRQDVSRGQKQQKVRKSPVPLVLSG